MVCLPQESELSCIINHHFTTSTSTSHICSMRHQVGLLVTLLPQFVKCHFNLDLLCYQCLALNLLHTNSFPSGIHAERAHLLTTVINNIALVPDYYKKGTLPFTVRHTDKLFSVLSDKGKFVSLHEIKKKKFSAMLHFVSCYF